MSTPKIDDLRISFIWVRTTLEFLKGKQPADAPMGFLGSQEAYEKKFDEIKGKATGEIAGGLTLPWHLPKDDFFWLYYLKKQPIDVTGKRAWKQLVPFRQRVPFTIKAPWLNARLFLEAFFYPHGLGVMFTVESREALTLDQARDLSFKVREHEQFDVQDSTGKSQLLKLAQLGERAMEFAAAGELGPGFVPGSLTIKPFSVWTVVRGHDVDPQLPTPSTGDVHRALEAVTTWNANFATAILPQLASCSVNVRKQRSSGDLMYANDRGRAVWYPGSFTLPPGKKRSLSCYHRNLALTSMQIESLARFVSDTAHEIKQPGDGAQLPLTQQYCAQRAAGILARMYGGKDDTTYRSGSPYFHIRQNNFVSDINKIRSEFLMTGSTPLV